MEENNKPGRSDRRRMFHRLGVLIFVLGVGSAGFIAWNAHRSAQQARIQGTSAADGSWRDGSLTIQDSKKSTRDVELYYGKSGMLALRLRDWFEQPESLALILAIGSTLAAVGCFLLADS